MMSGFVMVDDDVAEAMEARQEATILWIAGKHCEDTWEIAGVFDSADKAEAVCASREMFVGPMTLNEVAPTERCDWPGCYYPLAEKAMR